MFSLINVDCIEAAMKWLASQRPEAFKTRCEEYIELVLPSTDSPMSTWAWPEELKIMERLKTHRM